MTKISAAYGGLLNAETAENAGLDGEKLVIAAQEFDEKYRKIVLTFEGDGYQLSLNVTNANTLAEAFGDESDNWVGETVELYIDKKVEFGGKKVPGIRLKPIGGKAEVQEVK